MLMSAFISKSGQHMELSKNHNMEVGEVPSQEETHRTSSKGNVCSRLCLAEPRPFRQPSALQAHWCSDLLCGASVAKARRPPLGRCPCALHVASVVVALSLSVA